MTAQDVVAMWHRSLGHQHRPHCTRSLAFVNASERAHDRPLCTRSLAESYEDLKHYMNYFNHFYDGFSSK